MTNKPTAPLVRRYVVYTRAWFGKDTLDTPGSYAVERFILSDENGEIEVVIEWTSKVRSTQDRPCATLEMFSQGWGAFTAWPDLFQGLARSSGEEPPTPVDVEALLVSLGFLDVTETSRPADA